MPRIPSDKEIPADENYKLIAPGKYLVKIVKCYNKDKNELLLTDKHGNERWNITLQIMTQGEFYQERVFDNVIFSNSLMRRAKQIFNAFGINTSEGLEEAAAGLLIDRTAIANVINEEYNGKINNKIEFFDGYESIDSMSAQQVEDDQDIPF